MIKKHFYTFLILFFSAKTSDIPFATAKDDVKRAAEDTQKRQEKNLKDQLSSLQKPSFEDIQKQEERAIKQEKQKSAKQNDRVEINFENAALTTLLEYVSELYDSTFIIEEAAAPASQTAPGIFPSPQPTQPLKKLSEIKITYKSFSPMSEKQIWALVDLFLENYGYSRVAQKNVGEKIFRIIPTPSANKAVLPVYFAINPDDLPNNGRIRYIYFVKNSPVDQIKTLIDQLKSSNAQLQVFNDLRALIMTDSAYNVKALFNIIKELDAGNTPEVLSILKLQNAEASDVVKLYESLKQKDDPFKRAFEAKRFTSTYFPQDAKMIAEQRTNSLVILGSKDAVRRIEDFVTKYLDTKLQKLPSPIHVYQLNFAPADQVATILNNVTQFGSDSGITEFGGVRGGEKYFSKMFVQADKQGNRLLIRSSKEDFELIKPTIKELDKMQPQVAIEVLIVNLTLNKTKAIQSALRNKNESKINFQTSGFAGQGIQVDTTDFSGSLITNLINLATSAVTGTTLISLGKQSVWALIGVLDQVTELNVVSNPFLVATNKYQSSVKLGQTRRVISGQVVGGSSPTQNTFSSMDAAITVSITPQISSYGIVNLTIQVQIEEFTDSNTSNGNKSSKSVTTNADIADGEILALGGLIQNKENSNNTRNPLLGRIPIIKYLFSNNNKTKTNDNLLIFVAPKIISPLQSNISAYTQKKAQYARDFICDMESQETQTDPIYKYWLKEKTDKQIDILNDVVDPAKIDLRDKELLQQPKEKISLKDMVKKGEVNA